MGNYLRIKGIVRHRETMNLSNLSKGIAISAVFLVASIILYLLYQNKILPDLFFVIIAMGVVILTCVYIMIKPTKKQWKTIQVIPMKRKR